MYGHTDVCIWLLEAGADLNINARYMGPDNIFPKLRVLAPSTMPSCYQPIHCAAVGGWSHVCRLLVNKGADVSSRCVSFTSYPRTATANISIESFHNRFLHSLGSFIDFIREKSYLCFLTTTVHLSRFTNIRTY